MFKLNDFEIGDYVKICNSERWLKVISFAPWPYKYIDCIDSFGSVTDVRPEEILEVRLESEMSSGENF